MTCATNLTPGNVGYMNIKNINVEKTPNMCVTYRDVGTGLIGKEL